MGYGYCAFETWDYKASTNEYSNYRLNFATKKTSAWVHSVIATAASTWAPIFIAHAGIEYLIYAEGPHKLYYSPDDGASWSEVIGHNLATHWGVRMYHIGSEWALVTDDPCCFVSSDRVTWTEKHTTPAPNTWPTYEREVALDASGRLHVVREDGSIYYAVSDDVGDTWTETELFTGTVQWAYVIASGDAVAVATEDYDGATPRVRVAVTLDGGATFGAAATFGEAGLFQGIMQYDSDMTMLVMDETLYIYCNYEAVDSSLGWVIYASSDWKTGAPTFARIGQLANDAMITYKRAGFAAGAIDGISLVAGRGINESADPKIYDFSCSSSIRELIGTTGDAVDIIAWSADPDWYDGALYPGADLTATRENVGVIAAGWVEVAGVPGAPQPYPLGDWPTEEEGEGDWDDDGYEDGWDWHEGGGGFPGSEPWLYVGRVDYE